MDSATWWEPIEVAVGARWTRTVGQSELLIEHDPNEWRLTATSARHPETPSSLRVATSLADDHIVLHPRLAVLPIVARLEVPVRIASKDDITVYVGSPLGAEVEIGGPRDSAHKVGELRFYESPKTWFGPSTRTGELCFASRTSGRLRREKIEHRPDRAITAVHVTNASDEPLTIERVRIPVPNLSLYIAADRTLWTNRVLVNHVSADEPPVGELEDAPPTSLGIGDLEKLADARRPVHQHLLARAFGALL